MATTEGNIQEKLEYAFDLYDSDNNLVHIEKNFNCIMLTGILYIYIYIYLFIYLFIYLNVSFLSNMVKVIDENEMRTVLGAMFKLLGVDMMSTDLDRCVKNMMRVLDKNNDNFISKREFIDGMLSDRVLLSLMSPFT